jgi:hypothetical protein
MPSTRATAQQTGMVNRTTAASKESVGLMVVVHDLRIAEQADRSLQMRQGFLSQGRYELTPYL